MLSLQREHAHAEARACHPAVFYDLCQRLFAAIGLPTFFTFGATALVILLPTALFYRPKDVSLA
jgi:hypothetical protein